MEIDSNKNKKVLLISFHFPPYNDVAAVRIGKFAKYLADYGWEPIVLTVNNRLGIPRTLPVEINESKIVRTPYYAFFDVLSQAYRRINNQKSGNKSSGSQEKGIRNGSLDLKMYRLFESSFRLPVIEKFIFDPIGWYKPAVKAGLETINSNDIKIIFSSYSPSVSHFIAARLHQETGIPWVADYRDDWAGNYKEYHPQPLYYFDRQWEKHTLKYSDALVSINHPLAKILENSHHKIPTVIPNGFDDADFKNSVSLTSKFTITYTGGIWGKRDPSLIFQAFSEIKKEGKLSSEDIEIRFFGHSVNNDISPIIAKYNVQDFVKLGGSIPYKESIKKQMESSVLLLLSWNDPRDAGTTTGKIYEYLGANRPILAMAYPGGEIDKLLRQSGCGIVVNDSDEIKRLILAWFDEFKRTGRISAHFQPNHNIINSYTRKEQTRSLASVFDKLSICGEKTNEVG